MNIDWYKYEIIYYRTFFTSKALFFYKNPVFEMLFQNQTMCFNPKSFEINPVFTQIAI
jgi:hypothetical protein